MKTISAQTLSQLPSGFQESIIERSAISAAISNAKTFIKYAKDCKKSGDEVLTEYGLNTLMPYYNNLLSVEHLANKYSFLWLEKFSKCKHDAEKILNIGL